MLNREIKDFVQVTLGFQRSSPAFADMGVAKMEAAKILGVAIPTDEEFNRASSGQSVRFKRGRPVGEGLSKRDAVAAVAVYFESVGAGKEQAIAEAKRWLNISLSRRVAKNAVDAFRANTDPMQFENQAKWAYLVFKPGTTQKLPPTMDRTRKKRRKKIYLG